jgi:hypothetical protein
MLFLPTLRVLGTGRKAATLEPNLENVAPAAKCDTSRMNNTISSMFIDHEREDERDLRADPVVAPSGTAPASEGYLLTCHGLNF